MADDPALALVRLMAQCSKDPLRWVQVSFPWGRGPLEREAGPRPWQADVLREIGAQLQAGATVSQAIQMAVASGHGIGKSALVSWLVLWALTTHQHTRGVVTANTEAQLRTKTWPEVTKWSGMCVARSWLEVTKTAIFHRDHEQTWRIDAIPWSETNTEAFAGLHNKGNRILLVFDEASAIADKVWEVAEGALTDPDTQILWCAFGNPTRNTGRFRECFGRFAHRWTHRQIDARQVPGTNKDQIAKWVQDYGEDSDFVRVRVKGMWPRAGSMQFIGSDVVENACRVDLQGVVTPADPLVMSIDVARFGDDESVIGFRRGRDGRGIPPIILRGVDTMGVAGRAAEAYARYEPDMVFVDETGVGGGVVDRLRQLGVQVVGVNNGASTDVPVDGELVANKGAEMWARMRAWLKSGGGIMDDPDLRQQLEGREYGFNQHNAVVLEKKSDMKKRGLASPDRADQLALTFAYPVAPRPVAYDRELRNLVRSGQPQALAEYDPLAALR